MYYYKIEYQDVEAGGIIWLTHEKCFTEHQLTDMVAEAMADYALEDLLGLVNHEINTEAEERLMSRVLKKPMVQVISAVHCYDNPLEDRLCTNYGFKKLAATVSISMHSEESLVPEQHYSRPEYTETSEAVMHTRELVRQRLTEHLTASIIKGREPGNDTTAAAA